jgi:hypothetical protein
MRYENACIMLPLQFNFQIAYVCKPILVIIKTGLAGMVTDWNSAWSMVRGVFDKQAPNFCVNRGFRFPAGVRLCSADKRATDGSRASHILFMV